MSTFNENVPTAENPTADTVTIPKTEYNELVKSKNDLMLFQSQLDRLFGEWQDIFLQMQVNAKNNRLQIASIGK